MSSSKKKKKIQVVDFIDMGQFPAGYLCFSVGRTVEELKVYLISRLKDKGWNKDEVKKWIAGISNSPELGDKTWGKAIKTIVEKGEEEATLNYIIIRSFDFSDDDYAALAHEILHICQFVLPEFLDRDREREAEAYFHTHLMKEILKLMREAK